MTPCCWFLARIKRTTRKAEPQSKTPPPQPPLEHEVITIDEIRTSMKNSFENHMKHIENVPQAEKPTYINNLLVCIVDMKESFNVEIEKMQHTLDTILKESRKTLEVTNMLTNMQEKVDSTTEENIFLKGRLSAVEDELHKLQNDYVSHFA